MNEGNRRSFPAGYRRYLDWAQERGYSSRYVGSMVADVHRILLKGGVFPYPPTSKALAAPGQRILDVQPKDIHERVPVVLGSTGEVDHVVAQLA